MRQLERYVAPPAHSRCNSIAVPIRIGDKLTHDMKLTADTIRRSYPVQLSISLLAAAVLTGACSGANEPPRGSWEGTDSSATIPLPNARSICRHCIHLERIVVLGDTIGSGYVEQVRDVIRDHRGRYWVAGTGAVKVFDHLGRHVRNVGRSGRGPLEFGFARPAYTDASGNMHIFDTPDETIVDSAMRLVKIRRLPGPVIAMAPLPDSDRTVVNMWSRTASLIGLPLHIVSGSEVIHSFGVSPTKDTVPMTAFSSRRVVAVGPSGRVFSAGWYDYLIELWTSSGRRIIGFEGPVLNSVQVFPGRNSLENPPPNKILAIQEDSLGRVWVLRSQRRGDWQDAVEEVVDERGRIGLALKEGRSVYGGRIDVIDLSNATIIATWEGEAHLVSFVDVGLALEDHSLEDGTPQLVVWRVELESK
jgi:hypothetical protein